MTDSVITAKSSTFSANEGGFAQSSFILAPALTSATKVGVSLTGAGAVAGEDYKNFEYSMGNSGTWIPVTGGQITINAGYNEFQLRALISEDAFVESGESITFVVSQTVGSVGVKDSWWVASTAALTDVGGGGTPVTPVTAVTITADQAATTALEGGKAVASYTLSSALGAAAEINVSVTAQGASASDYLGLFYQVGTSTTWSAVEGGKITLLKDTNSFKLATNVTTDTLAEANESVVFVVSQSATATALKDSWWVASTAALTDVGGTTSGGPTTFTGSTGRDNFKGTAGADLFSIPLGSSLATNNGFDLITGMTQADKIDLPGSVFSILTFASSLLTEAALIAAIDGSSFGGGNNRVNVYTLGADAYVMFDENNNNFAGLTSDTFIKVVGGATLDFSTALV